MRICPNCGAQNPEQARFCTACGTPLDSLGEERRLVTAVFADIVDVQRRLEPGADPEDFTARLRPFHELLRRQIEGFGGTVEKIVGNVVFGVFGAPVTHEDDAERAIRSVLRIREEVQQRRRHDPSSLAVRVGVATGEVVVSLGSGPRIGERVTGDVVNTASRLQSTAPPDGIVVAESDLPRHAVRLPVAGAPAGDGEGQGRPDPHLVPDRVAWAHGDRATRPARAHRSWGVARSSPRCAPTSWRRCATGGRGS